MLKLIALTLAAIMALTPCNPHKKTNPQPVEPDPVVEECEHVWEETETYEYKVEGEGSFVDTTYVCAECGETKTDTECTWDCTTQGHEYFVAGSDLMSTVYECEHCGYSYTDEAEIEEQEEEETEECDHWGTLNTWTVTIDTLEYDFYQCTECGTAWTEVFDETTGEWTHYDYIVEVEESEEETEEETEEEADDHVCNIAIAEWIDETEYEQTEYDEDGNMYVVGYEAITFQCPDCGATWVETIESYRIMITE